MRRNGSITPYGYGLLSWKRRDDSSHPTGWDNQGCGSVPMRRDGVIRPYGEYSIPSGNGGMWSSHQTAGSSGPAGVMWVSLDWQSLYILKIKKSLQGAAVIFY